MPWELFKAPEPGSPKNHFTSVMSLVITAMAGIEVPAQVRVCGNILKTGGSGILTATTAVEVHPVPAVIVS